MPGMQLTPAAFGVRRLSDRFVVLTDRIGDDPGITMQRFRGGLHYSQLSAA